MSDQEIEKLKNLPPLSDEMESLLDKLASLMADDFFDKQLNQIND